MSTGFGWTLPGAAPSSSRTVPATTDGVQDLLGYDIYFHKTLQVSASGDYARVGGLDNLRAAIYRRLITRPGTYRFRPNYGAGVQTFVKKQATQANLDALRQRIVEQLLRDKRIEKVDVTVEWLTLRGERVLQVYVRCTTGGTERKFEPFTFKEIAA